MELNIKRMIIFLFILLLFPILCMADDQNNDDTEVLVTDFTYKMGMKDSRELSKKLALFGAKKKAVSLSAKYFTHKGLLEHYGKKENEIFCLAANEIRISIVDETFDERTKSYYVKIKAEVRITDFIKAEIVDLELEKTEMNFSYREEMEQYVSQSIDPGQELSRAYRYIRKGQWRIALIYLNHLGAKYPNWGDVYLAKAIGFYGIHDVEKMIDSLRTACSFDNQEACNDLRSLVRTHDQD